MTRKTHSENRYQDSVTEKSKIKKFPGQKKWSALKIEVSPDKVYTFDLDYLSHCPEIQQFFYKMLDLHHTSAGITISKHFPWVIRSFSDFINEYERGTGEQILTPADMDNKLLINFKFWLESRPKLIATGISNRGIPDKNGAKLKNSSVVSIYTSITQLLKKGRNLYPHLFPKLLGNLPRWKKQNPHVEIVRDVLSVDDLKDILAAARRECEDIIALREQVLESLEKTQLQPVLPLSVMKPKSYWRSLDNFIHSVIRENGLTNELKTQLNTASCLHKHPKAREILNAFIPVKEDALLPFALQLYIMTALNVSSVLNLRRDCIEDFPIQTFKRLIYDKPRAGKGRYKTHLIPAKINSTNDIDNPLGIIQFLLKWTQPLVEHAPEKNKNFLFIYRPANILPDLDRVKCVYTSNEFGDAMRRWSNRYGDKLKSFSPNDLRPAVASLLYLQTRDIFRVQRFLGHAHIRTTIKYIRGHVLAKEQDLDMSRGVEEMLEIIKRARRISKSDIRVPILAEVIPSKDSGLVKISRDESIKSDIEKNRKYGIMTLTSRCRDPLNPPQFLNIPRDKICSEIYKCLSCTNAVILEDDLPTILARIEFIWKERESLSEEGWMLIHEKGWLKLNHVVSQFSDNAVKSALEKLRRISG